MEFTFFNASSLIIDLMALLILVGMIVYTTLYRRRGKPEDKVFFALILADIVCRQLPLNLFGGKEYTGMARAVYVRNTSKKVDTITLKQFVKMNNAYAKRP